MARITIPREDRFWAKVRKETVPIREDLTPCWTWTAATHHNGYGTFQGMRAHRYSYEIQNGTSIPEGLLVLHQMRQPSLRKT